MRYRITRATRSGDKVVQLPESLRITPNLHWFDEVGSTNDVLRELVLSTPDSVVDRMVVATSSQTSGRGRLGREWIAPRGKTLAFSVLVQSFNAISPTWLPLIAGSAVRRALQRRVTEAGVRATFGVKWPNDVLVTEPSRASGKIAGILSEMLLDSSVIVGVGINTTMGTHERPVETASSLALLEPNSTLSDHDELLAGVLKELFLLLDRASSGAPGAAEQVHAMVSGDSATLGTQVVALMPSGEQVRGVAVRLAADGALVIRVADGREVVVAAGDIEHLR